MKFQPALESGVLVARYKRFFADVKLADGSTLTIHCPNTGAMTDINTPGLEVRFSRSDNPKRKLPGTLELVRSKRGWVYVNTGAANRVIAEALAASAVPCLTGYQTVQPEATLPGYRSRFDFLLRGARDGGPDCVVEVKSVSWGGPAGRGMFPDAKSERARRHVTELAELVAGGYRSVLLFAVVHAGVRQVRPAEEVDPEYARALRAAAAAGVEVRALRGRVNSREVRLYEPALVEL